jgi:fumarate reductase subunit C
MSRRPYTRPIPATWWLQRTRYILFMVREFTAVFIGGYAVLLLVMLSKLSDPVAFDAFVALPGVRLFHVLVLLAALFHTITWFNVAPQALVIHIGEERVPSVLIAGAHYAGWIVTSGIFAWVVL